MKHNSRYKKWRDNILSQLADNICAPCTDARKASARINLENPLACECSCEQVETIIHNMCELDKNLYS